MKYDNPRILVIGAGVNGSVCAAHLHAAGVAVLVPLVMKYHTDVRALARSRDDVRLMIAALCESLALLKAQGHRIVPRAQSFIAALPRFVLEMILRRMFNSKLGEVGIAWHAQQALDELQALADDLRVLVLRSDLPVPAIRKVLEIS